MTYKFTVPARDVSEELTKELEHHSRRVFELKEQIRRLFYKSDTYASVLHVTGRRQAGVEVRDSGVVEVTLPGVNSEPSPSYKRLEASTLNLLLSGKLLTDDQKMALLADLLPSTENVRVQRRRWQLVVRNMETGSDGPVLDTHLSREQAEKALPLWAEQVPFADELVWVWLESREGREYVAVEEVWS